MAERALLRPFFRNQSFGANEEKEFIFPMFHYRTLSLVVSAEDDGVGPGDNMTINVFMEINGKFVAHPVASGGTVEMNKLFFFTNEDVHGAMKVVIKAGATPPSGTVDVELWGWRN